MGVGQWRNDLHVGASTVVRYINDKWYMHKLGDIIHTSLASTLQNCKIYSETRRNPMQPGGNNLCCKLHNPDLLLTFFMLITFRIQSGLKVGWVRVCESHYLATIHTSGESGIPEAHIPL